MVKFRSCFVSQFSLNSDNNLSASSFRYLPVKKKPLALHVDADGRVAHDRRSGLSDTFRRMRPQVTACGSMLCSIRAYNVDLRSKGNTMANIRIGSHVHDGSLRSDGPGRRDSRDFAMGWFSSSRVAMDLKLFMTFQVQKK